MYVKWFCTPGEHTSCFGEYANEYTVPFTEYDCILFLSKNSLTDLFHNGDQI